LNYSLIPDFLAISGLVMVFGSLLRHSRQTRLRSWLIGWVMILLHIVAQIVNSALPDGRAADAADAVSMSMLLFTAATFIWAGNDRRLGSSRDLSMMLVATLPEAAFFCCQSFDVNADAPYLALTALGLISTVWGFRGRRNGPESNQRLGRLIGVTVVYGVQAILVLRGSVDVATTWMLFAYYLAAAFFFLRGAPRATIGVVFTTVCFVAWALVFPVADLLAAFLPSLKLEQEVWNLPKFLVATGMIFTLLEENMGKAEHASMHDALTGLPNRRMFVRQLETALLQAREAGSRVGVLVLDLNGFKSVNDNHGHAVGDELLCSVAGRLSSILRESDTLARMGGDEFAAILTDLPDRVAGEAIARKLAASLDASLELKAHRLVTRASVGLALYPDDGKDELSLFALADRRMYDYKSAASKITTGGMEAEVVRLV
jgi:diguanylate cyclase (GGDEF)-like protein